jgi:hypothetical protein
MPLFFLQKQALGASGSAYRGPARAIRARGSSTGEFHGGVPRGSSTGEFHGGVPRGSSTGEFRRLADRQYHNRKQNPAADSLQIAHS